MSGADRPKSAMLFPLRDAAHAAWCSHVDLPALFSISDFFDRVIWGL
jgi:hypothetical protein